jgi:hypothetical protein|tara:strand:- start:1948 stop:2178 length:231 start_codon:yes stop_codon:yes gene_type:complete
MTWLIAILCFSTGFALGLVFKTAVFESQPWTVLRWNKDSLGYRPVGIGSRLFQNDRVTMSLEIDTSEFPEEGVVVE